MNSKSQPRPTISSVVNFIVAVSAMALSIASFYATYLQANSAEQQVKAMTYPLIQKYSSNYDLESNEEIITISLANSGVGPAIIKEVNYLYKEHSYNSYRDFFRGCCEKEFKIYSEKMKSNSVPISAALITTSDSNIVIPVSDKIDIFQLRKHQSNLEFWNKLNLERHRLTLSTCYCSLIENCYLTEGAGIVTEVEACTN